MSSISAAGQGLYQYFQNITANQQSQATTASSTTSQTDATSQTASTTATTGTSQTDPTSTGTFTAPHVRGGHHGGGGGGGEFFQKIQAAVTSALQSAQSTDSSSDPNTVIQNAIAQVLKNQQNVTSGAAGSDSDGDTDAPGSADNEPSTAGNIFAQLLQSNGVNAQQFHEDFLTAIQSAQSGGSPDAAGVFANFPPGSLVDTLA